MIDSIKLREPLFVKPTLGLLDMLNVFQESRCHLAMVSNDPIGSAHALRSGACQLGECAILGLVTLEDVIEKIIQSELFDETDTTTKPTTPGKNGTTIFYHNLISNPAQKDRKSSRRKLRRASMSAITESPDIGKIRNIAHNSVVTANYYNP